MAANFEDYPNILKAECPWVPLREAGGLPNVKWCEETLCSYIAEPANTWSNLGYIVVAAVIWFLVRNEKQRMLRFWAPTAFWVGATSFVYHMSVTFVTQVFDFWGMYFFFGLVLMLNLLRLGTITKEKFFRILWSLISGLTVFTVVVAKLHLPVQLIVVALIGGTLVTEVIASKKSSTPVSHAMFFVCLFFIAIAFSFSISDATRAWCDRDNHVFQGHALWHVFGSVSILFAYFHYRQFKALYL